MDILKGKVQQDKECVPSTMYIRFKNTLAKDEEGKPLHLDFLMEKFKKEFDA